MLRIEKVVLEKVQRTYTKGLNITINATEFDRFAYLENGGVFKVSALLSEIGNSGLDKWTNVERMKKSTSNKNISTYLNQYVDKLQICK